MDPTDYIDKENLYLIFKSYCEKDEYLLKFIYITCCDIEKDKTLLKTQN